MNEFIEWCNVNQGFVSAILALVSICLSFIAIIVSIRVAKMPYKKKIAVGFYTNIGVGGCSGIEYYSIEATNIGNRVLKLSFLGVGYKKNGKWQKCCNIVTGNSQNVMLGINDTATVTYPIESVNDLMDKNTLYALAIDVEGKIYKRKIK